ncbi:Unknown protein sequence [Pseudomonas syringae pv. syringae]|nr:Unknown protein sequence [Pseudomonas syringae pv. syringae]
MAQALVGIHIGREQRGEVRHAGLLASNKMTKRVSRLTLRITEDVHCGLCCHYALMNMHRTARRMGQRFGHAHHDEPVLERNLLEQVLEQKSLIGQQQRIAMQQVDLELTDPHLVHHGVTWQAQRGHTGIHLGKKRPQTVVGADTECRVPLFASPVQPSRRLKRIKRLGIGREDKKLKFGGHHWHQVLRSVTGDNRLELITGGEHAGLAIEVLRITNGQGTRRRAPGQTVELLWITDQSQIAVVTAVKARRRIAAHDALQQHAARQLQTATFEKTFSRHHLAARHTVQIRGYTLHFINAHQHFFLRMGFIACHGSVLLVEQQTPSFNLQAAIFKHRASGCRPAAQRVREPGCGKVSRSLR